MSATGEPGERGQQRWWRRPLGGLRASRAAGRLAAAVALLAVPVFLTTGSVRWAFNEPRLYAYGFQRYGIPEATGIDAAELRRVADELIAYFNNDREWLEVTVQGRPLYNQREVVHMRDVKGLVAGVYRVQWASAALLAALALGGLALGGRAGLARALSRLRGGGLLTLVLLAAAGLGVAVAFRWLFYLFHVVSFRNPFWMLDPRTDILVVMFPEGFWLDATVFVALATAGQGLALVAACWGGLRLLGTGRARRRR